MSETKTVKKEIPRIIDPPVPYKPGSETARLGYMSVVTSTRSKVESWLLLAVPLAILLIGLVWSLLTH